MKNGLRDLDMSCEKRIQSAVVFHPSGAAPLGTPDRFALPAHCYVNVKRQFSLEGFSFCSNDGFLFFFNLRD